MTNRHRPSLTTKHVKILPGFDVEIHTPGGITIRINSAMSDDPSLRTSPTQTFWSEWVNNRINPVPVLPVKSIDLYAVYREWCIRNGHTGYDPKRIFLEEIGRRTDCRKSVRRFLKGSVKKQATFVFPNGSSPPDGVSEPEWLRNCVDDFSRAMKQWRS